MKFTVVSATVTSEQQWKPEDSGIIFIDRESCQSRILYPTKLPRKKDKVILNKKWELTVNITSLNEFLVYSWKKEAKKFKKEWWSKKMVNEGKLNFIKQ